MHDFIVYEPKDINIVRLALKTFEQFGMLELVDNVFLPFVYVNRKHVFVHECGYGHRHDAGDESARWIVDNKTVPCRGEHILIEQ